MKFRIEPLNQKLLPNIPLKTSQGDDAEKPLLVLNQSSSIDNDKAIGGNVYKARYEKLKNVKEKLTAEEKQELEILEHANIVTGGNFELLGPFSTDAEHSTIALMEKDAQFQKEAKVDRKLAEEKWLTAQFEGLDLNNEEDFDAIKDKMSELWNNCTTPAEKMYLAGIVKRTTGKYFKQINDNYEAVWKTMHAAINGDGDEQTENARQVGEAAREGRITKEIAVSITHAAPAIFKTDVLSDITIRLNESGLTEVTEALRENIESGKYTEKNVSAILSNALNNPLCTENQRYILCRLIGYAVKAEQLKHHSDFAEHYTENQDAEGMNALAEGIRYYAPSNQAPATQAHFDATYKLEAPEKRENAQLTLTNQIVFFDPSAQAEAHRIVCYSEFDSVLEQAAVNIGKYDESAQKEALVYTVSTGNGKAIVKAVETAITQEYSAISPKSQNYDSDLSVLIHYVNNETLDYNTDENKLNISYYENYLGNFQDSPVSISNNKKSLTLEELFLAKIGEVSSTYAKYQIIKSSINKKEKLEELLDSKKEILPSFIQMGLGPDLLEILGENSKYANTIINLMEQSNQDYKLAALARRDSELFAQNSCQTNLFGNKDLTDVDTLLKRNDGDKEYLVA